MSEYIRSMGQQLQNMMRGYDRGRENLHHLRSLISRYELEVEELKYPHSSGYHNIETDSDKIERKLYLSKQTLNRKRAELDSAEEGMQKLEIDIECLAEDMKEHERQLMKDEREDTDALGELMQSIPVPERWR